MSQKVRAELELATNVREIVRELEQLLGQLTQHRLLEIDLTPSINSIRTFGNEVGKLQQRIETAMRPLEKDRSAAISKALRDQVKVRQEMMPKLMASNEAQELRKMGASEEAVLKEMKRKFREAISMPDLKREADETNTYIKKSFYDMADSIGASNPKVEKLINRLNDTRETVNGINKELSTFDTLLKTVATSSNKATKTVDTAVREQQRILDNVTAVTTKAAVAQSKALAQATQNYKSQIGRMTTDVKNNFQAYNENTVKGLLTDMRREYEDMRRLRDEMVRRGELNATQAANFQRNLLSRQQLIESYEGGTMPSLQKRVLDQQFVSDRRLKQLDVWRKVGRAETASTNLNQIPNAQNVAKLSRQVASLQALANNLAGQRGLYEKGSKKLGIEKDPAYAQMLQILETNVTSKLNAYRNQVDAARVAQNKRAINQVASALDPSNTIDFSNVAYARARNMRAQQARIEEVRNAIERNQKGKMQAGGMTGTFASEIGRLDTLISQGTARLGHKNVGAAEVEELTRTLTEMRRLREKYLTDLAGYAQRDVDLQRTADREATASARQRLSSFKKMNQEARQEEARSYVSGLVGNPNAINKLNKDDVTYARAMVQQAHHMYRQGMPNVPGEMEMAGVRNALDARMKQLKQATFGQRMMAAFGFNGGGAYNRENDSVMHHINKRVTNVAQMMGTSLYGMGIFGLGSAVAGGTIGQAAQKETLTNTLAGLINSYAKFTDVTGNAVGAQQNFQASLSYSGKVYDMLREKAVKSILTTQEMFDYFMSGAPQLMARGMNVSQSIKIVDAIASLGKAMGLSNTAVQSDVRDLAMGTVTVRSQVLRTMGMNSDELKSARSQGPQALAAYFDRIIAGVKPALDRLEDTTTSKLSKFMDTVQQIGIKFGEVMAPIVMPYLEKFEKSIMTWVSSGNAEKFAKSFADLIGGIFSVLDWFVTNAAPLVSSIDNLIVGGIMLVLTKTAAQALIASNDFKAAMASLLPTIIDMAGASSNVKTKMVQTAGGEIITQGVASTIMAGGAKGNLAAAFPTFASMGAKFKAFFAGIGGQITAAIAASGIMGTIGNAFKAGFVGLGTMIATAGRGIVAMITSTTGMILLSLTAAIAAIMLLKHVVDNDRKNVDFLENMNENMDNALAGKGSTPEQILEARKRAYTQSFNVNDPNALRASLKNPNLGLAQQMNQAGRETSERMQKYGATWNPDWAQAPVNEAIKNTLDNRVDQSERMGFIVNNLNRMYNRNFTDQEAITFLGNNADARQRLEAIRQQVVKDPNFAKKLAEGNPIFGAQVDPEIQKRLAETKKAYDINKLNVQLGNLERSSERAARRIAALADSAEKGGVNLKVQAMAEKARADVGMANTRFRIAERNALVTLNDVDATDADKLAASGDLVQAQMDQIRTIESLRSAYNDQLRQIRENIIGQREELAAKKESARISGLQVEADRKKMELSRMDYGRSGDLSGYLQMFNAAFNSEMRASNAAFAFDIKQNRNEQTAIKRQADSDAKVQSFFSNNSNPQFTAARMMAETVTGISRVYASASGVIAEASKTQASATGQAIESTNNLNSTMQELNQNVVNLNTTMGQTGATSMVNMADRATLEAKVKSLETRLATEKAKDDAAFKAEMARRTGAIAPQTTSQMVDDGNGVLVRRQVPIPGTGRAGIAPGSATYNRIADEVRKSLAAQSLVNTDKLAYAKKELAQFDKIGSAGNFILNFTNQARSRGMKYDFGATIAEFNKNLADCSSFVSVLGSELGILNKGVRETSVTLYGKSSPVAVGQAGDLVFSSGTIKGRNGISHVGMMIDGNRVAQMGSSGARVMSLEEFKRIGKFEGIRRLNAGGTVNVPATMPSGLSVAGVSNDGVQRVADQLALQQKQMELWMRVTERVNELNQKFNELVQTSSQLAGAFENSIEQIRDAQRGLVTAGLSASGVNAAYNMRISSMQSAQQAYMNGNGVEYLDPEFARLLGIPGGGSNFGKLRYNADTGSYEYVDGNGKPSTSAGSYQQLTGASGTVFSEAIVLRNALGNAKENPQMLEMAKRNMLFKMLMESPSKMPKAVRDYLDSSGKSLDQVIQLSRSGDPEQMAAIPADVRKGIDEMFKPITEDFLQAAMESMLKLSSALNASAHDTAMEMTVAIEMLQTNANVFNERFAEVFQRMSSQMNRDMELIGLVGYELSEAKARNAVDARIEQLQSDIQRKQEGAFYVAEQAGTFKPLDALMQGIAKTQDMNLSPEARLAKARGLTGDVGAIIAQLPEEQRGALTDLWNEATKDTDNLGTDLVSFFTVLREQFMDAIVKGIAEGDVDKLREAIRERKMLEVQQRQAAAIREAEATHEQTKMRNKFNRDQGEADQQFADFVGGGSFLSAIGGATPMDGFNRDYDRARSEIDRGADEAVAKERLRLRTSKLFGVPLESYILQRDPNYYDRFRNDYVTKGMAGLRSKYKQMLPRTRTLNTADAVVSNFAQTFMADPFAYVSGRKNFGEEIGNILGPVTSGHSSLISDSMKGLFNLSYMTGAQLAKAYPIDMFPQFYDANGNFSKGAAMRGFGYNLAGNFLGNMGGNLLGQALFPGKDPTAIGLGTSLGTAAGGMLAAAGTGIFGASGLFGLGAAAGPVGMIVGGVIGGLFGGLFGGKKKDPEEERQKQLQRQHQQRLEELLSRIDRSLRPMPDYFRVLRNDVLYGSASGWYSGRAYASLGRQVNVGVR